MRPSREMATAVIFLLARPSANGRRVGIRIDTLEACAGFTRVTARRIAQPPKATFVTRLQPGRLPDKAARQLPDLSTSIRVEPSSTGDPRLRGALPRPAICTEVDAVVPCVSGQWLRNDSSTDFGAFSLGSRARNRPPARSTNASCRDLPISGLFNSPMRHMPRFYAWRQVHSSPRFDACVNRGEIAASVIH